MMARQNVSVKNDHQRNHDIERWTGGNQEADPVEAIQLRSSHNREFSAFPSCFVFSYRHIFSTASFQCCRCLGFLFFFESATHLALLISTCFSLLLILLTEAVLVVSLAILNCVKLHHRVVIDHWRLLIQSSYLNGVDIGVGVVELAM